MIKQIVSLYCAGALMSFWYSLDLFLSYVLLPLDVVNAIVSTFKGRIVWDQGKMDKMGYIYEAVRSRFSEVVKPIIVEPVKVEKTFSQLLMDRIIMRIDYVMGFVGMNAGGLYELSMEIMVYVGLVIMVLLLIVFIKCFVCGMLGLLRRVLFKGALKARGVMIPEAAMLGSDFVKGAMPRSQFGISKPGFISDTHIGFAVRAKGFVVTAKHVLAPFLGEQVLLVSGGKKALWTVSYKESTGFNDIVFCFIDPNILSSIGVPEASVARTGIVDRPVYASAYGMKGRTSGMVRKNASVRGLLIYDGSTEKGMSGGAIWVNDTAVSIHNGVVDGYNMSTYLHFLVEEAATHFVTEASEDTVEQYAIAKGKKSSRGVWSDSIMKEAKISIAQTDAKIEKIRAAGGVVWADLDEEASAIVVNGRKYVPASEAQAADDEIRAVRPKTCTVFCCDLCNKIFRTEKSLDEHARDVHFPVVEKMESADVETVEFKDGDGKTGSFLEQRPSVSKSSKKSSDISKLVSVRQKSTSLPSDLNKPSTSGEVSGGCRLNQIACTGQSSVKMRS